VTDAIVRNSSPTVSMANLLAVLVDYRAGYKVENILHPQMNGSGFTVTYRPARLRSGSLRLLFPTATAAKTAATLLVTPYTFDLAADVTSASMTFVLAPGDLDIGPADEGVDQWALTVPYQEVV
jgi:hypothetical protein